MSEKLIIECEKVDEMLAFRSLINTHPLQDIVWLRGGSLIEISAKQVEEFLDTGLSNVDFYRYDFFTVVEQKETEA